MLSELGAPTIKLTTTGAKTGKERNVPVLGLKNGERWILVASNWGRAQHPAWYHNLKANPEVKLTFKNRTGKYVAEELTGDERDAYWNRIKDVNPSLESYQQRS
ncbi:MAG: nitroreductase family deazaflavin-dependent oxidoreductase [Halolamina sp.]|uniref:nitroreductase family deazaflavin-dependent oxidoreductase n=1 Tax=Halolamina sp. TaxID=1940283 RepID=UPI002FC2E328